MSIPIELLEATAGEAPPTCVYASAGNKKTHITHTFPPPILMHDFEQGTGSLGPWIRRWRNFDGHWNIVTQEAREKWLNLSNVPEDQQSKIPPRGLIDLIKYDVFNPESYDHFFTQVADTPRKEYNTVVIDSLQELSIDIQTFTKKQKGIEPMGLMHVKAWGPVQERNAILLRKLKEYKKSGIFVYLIASEAIDKAYIKDPREGEAGGGTQEPYATKGTVNVPGQLTGVVPGIVDILLRARIVNGKTMLVRTQETIAAGVSWETKDRWGRLPDMIPPSFYTICTYLYGKEGARAIYENATSALGD